MNVFYVSLNFHKCAYHNIGVIDVGKIEITFFLFSSSLRKELISHEVYMVKCGY